jgi:hypothetical protein
MESKRNSKVDARKGRCEKNHRPEWPDRDLDLPAALSFERDGMGIAPKE